MYLFYLEKCLFKFFAIFNCKYFFYHSMGYLSTFLRMSLKKKLEFDKVQCIFGFSVPRVSYLRNHCVIQGHKDLHVRRCFHLRVLWFGLL